jgi:hypothetical protein
MRLRGWSVPSRTVASRKALAVEVPEAAQSVNTVDVAAAFPAFETPTVALSVWPIVAWLRSSVKESTRRSAPRAPWRRSRSPELTPA